MIDDKLQVLESFSMNICSSFMNISSSTENIDPTLQRASVRYCERKGVPEPSESPRVCQEPGLLFVPCCNAACPESCSFLFVEILQFVCKGSKLIHLDQKLRLG